MSKTKNPVAKFAHRFNKHKVEVDRKQRAKRGYSKHKGQGEPLGLRFSFC